MGAEKSEQYARAVFNWLNLGSNQLGLVVGDKDAETRLILGVNQK